MKQVTLTLNPCLDKTLYFEGPFRTGVLNRSCDSVLCAGGKGINVARVFRKLGVPCEAVGFAGGESGAILEKLLDREQITCALTKTRAQTRLCVKMIDAEGVFTEANETGGPITKKELTALLERLNLILKDTEPCCCTLSGSVPAGIGSGVYADLIRFYRDSGTRFILDAEGDALSAGVAERPWLIKPNRAELAGLMHFEIDSFETAVFAARQIVKTYGTRVLCTLGDQGSFYTDEQRTVQINAPHVPVRGFTGAGDTYLATFLTELESGRDVEEALRVGAAMATAKITCPGTVVPSREDAEPYLERIHLTILSV